MTEEEEWCQLGVLSYQPDGRTEFGRRAEMRHTAQKAMVNIDTGRRYAAALLRHCRNVEKNYTVGDLIMCKTKRSDVVNEEKSSTRVSDWNGPARIIGFDKDVVWLQHAAAPVASAVHLLRPATA